MVYPVKTSSKGWGLAAGEFIKRGTFVMQYFGEVFDTETKMGSERLKKYRGSTCTYLMKTEKSLVIDPTNKGSVARFINHSCDPNCETQKWNVLGEPCVGIFATRDIREGEELSFDYHFDCYSTPLTKCFCGAKNCKGYLGVMPPSMSPEKWEKKLDSMPCAICKLVQDAENNQMLICDECNQGYHALCLEPKIYVIPKEAWYCPSCINKRCAAAKVVEAKPPEPELGPPLPLDEILNLAREAEQEIEDAHKEYRRLTNEEQLHPSDELRAAINKLEKKFVGYSKNFMFYYLLQKKVKKHIRPERTPTSDESSSPRKNHTSSRNATKPFLIPLPPELQPQRHEERKHRVSTFSSPSPTAPLPPVTIKLDPQKSARDQLQRELEDEVRRIIKKKEEDISQLGVSPPANKKERSVLKLPVRDLENVRLCLNVFPALSTPS